MVGWTVVGGLLVGWQVVGGRLVGGFKKTSLRRCSLLQVQNKKIFKLCGYLITVVLAYSCHHISLSSHTIVSCGIKLLRTLKTVLLKMSTFSFTRVCKKVLCQSTSSTDFFISSVLASLQCQTCRKGKENKFENSISLIQSDNDNIVAKIEV